MQFAQRIKVRWVLHSMIDGRGGARIRQLSGSALSARARWGRLLSCVCAAQHRHSASTHALAIVATRRSAARESQRERMTTVASLEAAAAVAAMTAEAADLGADAPRPGDDAASSRLAEVSALISTARR